MPEHIGNKYGVRPQGDDELAFHTEHSLVVMKKDDALELAAWLAAYGASTGDYLIDRIAAIREQEIQSDESESDEPKE